MIRSMIGGSAMTWGRSGGKSTVTARAAGPKPSSEHAMISPRSAGLGNTGKRPGLQSAHVQQAGDQIGELLQGLIGGGQQFVMVLRRQRDVTRTQAADRGLRRGQRRAQVVADRRE